MGQTGACSLSFLAPGRAPGVRGPAGHTRRQQHWPHPAPSLHGDGQAEAGGRRGRSRATQHAGCGLSPGPEVQQTRNIFNQWSNRLSAEEHEMLREYSSGAEVPDEGDPFPELSLSVDQSGLDKPMGFSKSMLDVQMLPGKTLYRYCVVAVHKEKLSTNRDTVWKQRLQGRAPVWRLLYKPPLNKRTGDLQWRILQGALAVSFFISKINPTVRDLSLP